MGSGRTQEYVEFGTIRLKQDQWDEVKKLSQEGISSAEHIRRALDLYLSTEPRKRISERTVNRLGLARKKRSLIFVERQKQLLPFSFELGEREQEAVQASFIVGIGYERWRVLRGQTYICAHCKRLNLSFVYDFVTGDKEEVRAEIRRRYPHLFDKSSPAALPNSVTVPVAEQIQLDFEVENGE